MLVDIHKEYEDIDSDFIDDTARVLLSEWSLIHDWMLVNYPVKPAKAELPNPQLSTTEQLTRDVALGLGYKTVIIYEDVPEWTRYYTLDMFGNETNNSREYPTPGWYAGKQSPRLDWVDEKGKPTILGSWTSSINQALGVLKRMPKGSFSIEQFVHELDPDEIARKICEVFVSLPDVQKRIKGNG